MQRSPDDRPFGYGYEPPAATGSRPAVILWFRVYCATVLTLYVGFFVLWQFLTPSGPTGPHHNGPPTATVVAIGSVVVAIAAFYMLAALVPYRPWGWTVGLVAICLGLSTCLVVAAVPLLVYWMKPTTKAAFGRL